MKIKKLAYVTGTRAEYGIVKRLLRKLQEANEIHLSILVTGMHLERSYGYTVEHIKNDGFDIQVEIPLKMNSSDNHQILSTLSECIEKFSRHFFTYQYDAILLLGDRYEIFAVAIAAAIHNIPIIHIHGGEKTLGNYDEFIRHSITKMSKLHLVSTDEYRNRVIQLGEHPATVINIGSLGVENILSLSLLSKPEVDSLIHYSKPYYVVLFHPETITGNNIDNQVDELLHAIEQISHDYDFVFLGANSDTSSYIIQNKIREYSKSKNFCYFESLTPEQYFSVLKYSEGLIGNSSSGIIEAPSLGIPTVNIGERQLGRIKGTSIVNCNITSREIINAIKATQKVKIQIEKNINPYARTGSLESAYQAIITFIQSDVSKNLKDFYDINFFFTEK